MPRKTNVGERQKSEKKISQSTKKTDGKKRSLGIGSKRHWKSDKQIKKLLDSICCIYNIVEYL